MGGEWIVGTLLICVIGLPILTTCILAIIYAVKSGVSAPPCNLSDDVGEPDLEYAAEVAAERARGLRNT